MGSVDELVKKLIEIGGLVGLVVGLLITVIGWLGKQAISGMLKNEHEKYKSELAQANNAELARVKNELGKDLTAYKLQLETVAKSDDRIRNEILTWANPILEAVNGLESRLRNILTTKGYEALEPGFSQAEWSITYDYFLNSTMFLFGQYFCWTHMLHQELSFELFRSQQEMKDFFAKVDKVCSKLSDYPPYFNGQQKEYDGIGHDAQIFRLQQHAMGEMLAMRRGNRRSCRSYAYFLTKLVEPIFSATFAPVRKLLEQVNAQERRWKRLEDTHRCLVDLQTECNRLLELPPR